MHKKSASLYLIHALGCVCKLYRVSVRPEPSAVQELEGTGECLWGRVFNEIEKNWKIIKMWYVIKSILFLDIFCKDDSSSVQGGWATALLRQKSHALGEQSEVVYCR